MMNFFIAAANSAAGSVDVAEWFYLQ